jgi:hypothetical protein
LFHADSRSAGGWLDEDYQEVRGEAQENMRAQLRQGILIVKKGWQKPQPRFNSSSGEFLFRRRLFHGPGF